MLNWGLGHATRSIPVIKALSDSGHEVHVVSDGIAFDVLKAALGNLCLHQLPDSNFTYPSKNIFVNAILQLPNFIRHIYRDFKHVKKLSRETGANVIISDNRFVFSSALAEKNIYITHQVRLYHSIPFVAMALTFVHRIFIRRFDVCWIPDDEKIRLAGLLSDSLDFIITRYIGLLSRLPEIPRNRKEIEVTFLLSGPEPQRTRLEKSVLDICNQMKSMNICLIRGTKTLCKFPVRKMPNLNMIDMASPEIIADLLAKSRMIVCRPGYSTLMDIHQQKIPIVLVPTPGQTEQEYLARHVSSLDKKYHIIPQNHFADSFLTYIKNDFSH